MEARPFKLPFSDLFDDALFCASSSRKQPAVILVLMSQLLRVKLPSIHAWQVIMTLPALPRRSHCGYAGLATSSTACIASLFFCFPLFQAGILTLGGVPAARATLRFHWQQQHRDVTVTVTVGGSRWCQSATTPTASRHLHLGNLYRPVRPLAPRPSSDPESLRSLKPHDAPSSEGLSCERYTAS